MKGVIQRVYNSFRRLKGFAPQDVRKISEAELKEIYRDNYWNAVKGDLLPVGLDLVVFDFGVNSGPSRSIKFLQKGLNKADKRRLKVDGLMGPATIDAATSSDTQKLIAQICDSRLGWLHTLKTWVTFGGGWGDRVKGIKSTAAKMVETAPRSPEVDIPGTIEPEIVSPVLRPETPVSLGAPGDVQTPSTAPIGLSITGLIGALGTSIVSAVNNPYALVFTLALLAIGGFIAYRFLTKGHRIEVKA